MAAKSQRKRPCAGRPTARLCVVLLACLLMSAVTALQSTVADAADVYTIANYPIQAVDRNAVRAKEAAISSGQIRALRSLMKRLIPVTSYSRIPTIPAETVEQLVDGLSVRKEQNSSTEYLAVIDFSFSRRGVRDLLRGYQLEVVDSQSEPVTLVPVFSPRPRQARAASDLVGGLDGGGDGGVGLRLGNDADGGGPPALRGFDGARGLRAWSDAWRALDLDNALTPLRLAALRPSVSEAVVAALLDGDLAASRGLAVDYGTGPVLIAYAEPSADGRLLNVIITGRDAVGPIYLKRRYSVDAAEVEFTLEMAGVIGLGVLEGRWKERQRVHTGSASIAGGGEAVTLLAQFSGLADWRAMQRTLRGISGVSNFQVEALSPRGAQVSMHYPGGITALSGRLANVGLRLYNQNGTWIVSR